MPKLGRAEERLDAHKIYMERVEEVKDQRTEDGWYQDKAGRLYHFDGNVWDVIPEEVIQGLEYLG